MGHDAGVKFNYSLVTVMPKGRCKSFRAPSLPFATHALLFALLNSHKRQFIIMCNKLWRNKKNIMIIVKHKGKIASNLEMGSGSAKNFKSCFDRCNAAEGSACFRTRLGEWILFTACGFMSSPSGERRRCVVHIEAVRSESPSVRHAKRIWDTWYTIS